MEQKVIIIFCFFVIFLVLLSGGIYMVMQQPTNTGVNPPQTINVDIVGAFQSDFYRSGRYGIMVKNGQKNLNSRQPITALFNPHIESNINLDKEFHIKVLDLVSFADNQDDKNSHDSPYKTVEWLEFKDKIPQHIWGELTSVDKKHGGNPIIYVTEGGLFTEKEMKKSTELHFYDRNFEDNVNKIFIKLTFPNGKKPHSMLHDNNIISEFIRGDKNNTVKVAYGIPEKSVLEMITRDKSDGPEKVVEKYIIPEAVNRLYIDGNGIKIIGI